MIHCENTGLVYTNPSPHLKAVHAWHPSLAYLGGDEFVCAFDLGEAAESLDYRTYYSRTLDGGQSWKPPERLFEDDGTRRSTHTVRIAALPSGDLVGFGAALLSRQSRRGTYQSRNPRLRADGRHSAKEWRPRTHVARAVERHDTARGACL